MKMNLFFAAFLFATSAYARFFNCSSIESQHDVLRLQLNQTDDLVAIAEIAQLPFSAGQIVNEFVNVAAKVEKDKSGTQSVLFADHYTEKITLRLNLTEKTAQIEVFDTDDWNVTRTEDLKCDFDGYYE